MLQERKVKGYIRQNQYDIEYRDIMPSRRSSVKFALSPSKRRSSIMPSPDTPHSRRQSMAITEMNGDAFLEVPEVWFLLGFIFGSAVVIYSKEIM